MDTFGAEWNPREVSKGITIYTIGAVGLPMAAKINDCNIARLASRSTLG
jgi:hypothetical protein